MMLGDNADELALIAQEVGADAIRGSVRYPGWAETVGLIRHVEERFILPPLCIETRLTLTLLYG